MDRKPQFLSTVWTIIEKAKHRDESAFQEVYLRYKAPIMTFISRMGFSKEAEDLAQEVFLKIFDDELLKKVNRSKGRFRNFLLTVVKNITGTYLKMQGRQKRVADKGILSIEADNIDIVTTEQEKEEFEKLWVLNLIETAYKKLEDECKKNSLLYHVALKLFVEHDMTYQEIADQMNKTSDEVKNYIYRGKEKLKGYIEDEIAFYSESTKEYSEELEYISKYMEL